MQDSGTVTGSKILKNFYKGGGALTKDMYSHMIVILSMRFVKTFCVYMYIQYHLIINLYPTDYTQITSEVPFPLGMCQEKN